MCGGLWSVERLCIVSKLEQWLSLNFTIGITFYERTVPRKLTQWSLREIVFPTWNIALARLPCLLTILQSKLILLVSLSEKPLSISSTMGTTFLFKRWNLMRAELIAKFNTALVANSSPRHIKDNLNREHCASLNTIQIAADGRNRIKRYHDGQVLYVSSSWILFRKYPTRLSLLRIRALVVHCIIPSWLRILIEMSK
jgi:hypothetical protein